MTTMTSSLASCAAPAAEVNTPPSTQFGSLSNQRLMHIHVSHGTNRCGRVSPQPTQHGLSVDSMFALHAMPSNLSPSQSRSASNGTNRAGRESPRPIQHGLSAALTFVLLAMNPLSRKQNRALRMTTPLTTTVTLAWTTQTTSTGAVTMTLTPSDPTKCAAPASLRSDGLF